MNASERLLANHQIDHSCSREQFPLLTPEAIKALRSPQAIWAGILLATGFSTLFGVPGCGKTFFALNLAAHVALGWVFFGRKTFQCRVVYVALEGLSGLKERIMAWEHYYCTPYPADVRFMIQPFSLGSEQDVSLLVHQITRCGGANLGLVIFDTLARASTNLDGNSARDMTKVLAGISAFQQTLSHVLVLHHPGKDQARGMRGSTVVLGAADTVIRLTRKGEDRKWVVDKSRDGQEGISGHFRLETIDLGESIDGDAITSCVAVPCAGSHTLPDTTLPRGPNQRSVLQAITALLTQQQLDRTNGVCQDEPGILFEDVGTVCDSALSHIDDKHRKTRFKEALDGLIAGGFLSLNESRIKLASD